MEKGELKRNWIREELAYGVGALLYSPAIQPFIADSVAEGKFAWPYSLALCLEDSISDDAVDEAEGQLAVTLEKLKCFLEGGEIQPDRLPLIFVRVREPEQIKRLEPVLVRHSQLVAGLIFPKFSVRCADQYISYMKELNEKSQHIIYMMPILESYDLADLRSRYHHLYEIKEKLNEVRHFVLNIRVGGNDFSNYFGVRRSCRESIYDVQSVSSILIDILTVFVKDYVVSGPVWEYFAGKEEDWKGGLEREVRLDMVNGFVGKTVIHPAQISVVNRELSVKEEDYQDALSILKWDGQKLGVGKNQEGGRMNEKKTHQVWAEKIIILAKLYGVRSNENL